MAKKAPELVQDSSIGKINWMWEVLLLIWSLAGLGYFYYTQFLKPLWTQFFG